MKSIIFGMIVMIGFLLVITAIHEFGHYIMLRIFRIPVKEFSIGIGPVLHQWKRVNIWSLRIFPFMAYVDFDIKDNSYLQLVLWKKLAILSAGIINNLILALICLLPTWFNLYAFNSLMSAFDTHLGIGPISIFIVIVRLSHYSFVASVLFLGIFSLLAGIINLLPVPGFDGGWILTTILHIPEAKCEPIAVSAVKVIKIVSVVICVIDVIILIFR